MKRAGTRALALMVVSQCRVDRFRQKRAICVPSSSQRAESTARALSKPLPMLAILSCLYWRTRAWSDLCRYHQTNFSVLSMGPFKMRINLPRGETNRTNSAHIKGINPRSDAFQMYTCVSHLYPCFLHCLCITCSDSRTALKLLKTKDLFFALS
jgi:hypothetical protein